MEDCVARRVECEKVQRIEHAAAGGAAAELRGAHDHGWPWIALGNGLEEALSVKGDLSCNEMIERIRNGPYQDVPIQLRPRFDFTSSIQFSTTWSCAEFVVVPLLIIRNRWPSGDTSNAVS